MKLEFGPHFEYSYRPLSGIYAGIIIHVQWLEVTPAASLQFRWMAQCQLGHQQKVMRFRREGTFSSSFGVRPWLPWWRHPWEFWRYTVEALVCRNSGEQLEEKPSLINTGSPTFPEAFAQNKGSCLVQTGGSIGSQSSWEETQQGTSSWWSCECHRFC